MRKNSIIKELKKNINNYKIRKTSDLNNGYKKDALAIRNDWKKIGF